MMSQNRRQFAEGAFRSCSACLNRGRYYERSFIGKVDLFDGGQDGYALYWIPGIGMTKKGTILAYCEARKSDRGDLSKTNLPPPNALLR